MGMKWNCDKCDKRTYVHPETEQEYGEKTINVKVPREDPDDPKKTIIKTEPMVQKVPKMTTMRQQNSQTGKVAEIQIPKLKDLQERALIISLRIGLEKVQVDVCSGCLEKEFPELQPLFVKLAKLANERKS